MDCMELKDTINTLNGLVETLKDGQHGYRVASEDVKDPELKSLFASYSLQRSNFAGELQNELIRLGESSPDEDSTVTSALHRGWINLKSALSGGGRSAVLNECERGDEHALAAFEKASQSKTLPGPLLELVQRQYHAVVSARDTVKAMKSA